MILTPLNNTRSHPTLSPSHSPNVEFEESDHNFAISEIEDMELLNIPSAWRGHEAFVEWLMALVKPNVICELGADYGYSALILERFSQALVYTVDHFQGDTHSGIRNVENECRGNIDRLSAGRIRIIKSDFASAAAEWKLPIDILHIDGDHSAESVQNDLACWLPHVRAGGVILMHDTTSFPETVGKAFQKLPYAKFNFNRSYGLGVAFKPHFSGPHPAALSRECGIVIGTFAAVPFIHLQLEARKRHYPDVLCLIHDDASPNAQVIEQLAHTYGAEFVTFPVRKTHHLGDLNIYPTALSWSQRRRLKYLLKISRRWIWLENWTDDLIRLFEISDAPTLSNYSISYGFGFRTECVAFNVAAWCDSRFISETQARIDSHTPTFVENFVHIWAQRLADQGSEKWKTWRHENPVSEDRSGYAPWMIMGNCRHTAVRSHLWHDSHPPEAYGALAQAWGLPYTAADFRDPNMGFGSGDP